MFRIHYLKMLYVYEHIGGGSISMSCNCRGPLETIGKGQLLVVKPKIIACNRTGHHT